MLRGVRWKWTYHISRSATMCYVCYITHYEQAHMVWSLLTQHSPQLWMPIRMPCGIQIHDDCRFCHLSVCRMTEMRFIQMAKRPLRSDVTIIHSLVALRPRVSVRGAFVLTIRIGERTVQTPSLHNPPDNIYLTASAESQSPRSMYDATQLHTHKQNHTHIHTRNTHTHTSVLYPQNNHPKLNTIKFSACAPRKLILPCCLLAVGMGALPTMTMTLAERAGARHVPFFFMKKVFRRWPSTRWLAPTRAQSYRNEMLRIEFPPPPFRVHTTHRHTRTQMRTQYSHNRERRRRSALQNAPPPTRRHRQSSLVPSPAPSGRNDSDVLCVWSDGRRRRRQRRRRRHRLHRVRAECGSRHHTATASELASPNDRITDLRSTCTRRVDNAGVASSSFSSASAR